MLLLKLWNYIKGYVIILVEGYSVEKFINACTQRHMHIWDIKRVGMTSVKIKMNISSFKKIRPISRLTNCRVSLLSKIGLPFVLRKYRKRKTFLIGAFICIIIFNILISFIWVVEIEGNKNVTSDEIKNTLLNHGIKPGIVKYNIDTDKVANALMLEIDKLAWTSVSVKGTKIKVNIAERRKPPEIIDVSQPCHIVATRDGLIDSIITQSGSALVKSGDTVIKGQVLVSGVLENKNDKTDIKLVHSLAIVNARTWYEGKSPAEDTITEKFRTGNNENVYYIEVFNKRFRLPFTKQTFISYDKLETVNRLSIGKDMVLPFGVVTEQYLETNTRVRNLEKEDALQLAADRAYALALEKVPIEADIKGTSLEFKYDKEGRAIADVVIECIENIGMKQKIGGY